MLTTGSFVEASCFAEGFSPSEPSEEAEARKRWIASEEKKHRAKILEHHAARRRAEEERGEVEREERRRVRRHGLLEEVQSLSVEEELGRLRHRVARLEVGLAGADWDGSSSFEALDAEEDASEYDGWSTDGIKSMVEVRRVDPKHWRTRMAAGQTRRRQ
jgi:hypothetical protein